MLQLAPALISFMAPRFLFFRDHHLSAYPALHRNPFNPDPFFQRKQFGLSLGGPFVKDRAFFFGSFERPDQSGVISTEFLLSPDFAALSGIYPSPTYVNQFSARTDIMLNQSAIRCSCATHTRATSPTRHSEVCTLRRGPGRPVGPTRALLGSLRSWVPAW